jgi:hypothetical protein
LIPSHLLKKQQNQKIVGSVDAEQLSLRQLQLSRLIDHMAWQY